MSLIKSKYLIINKISEKQKTNIYEVVSKSSGIRLATILWYGSWRQYVLEPEEFTIWNDGCLTDIVKFLKELKEKKNG